VALPACRSDDNNGVSPASKNTGRFIDTTVSSLKYILNNDGTENFTNELGEFGYSAGDKIEFLVGGVSLGSTEVREIIKPLHLNDDAAKAQTRLSQIKSLDYC